MNDLGQIVGESQCEKFSQIDGHHEQHAFLWQNGIMVDLGSLSGDLGLPGDRSRATGINNQGHIIGTSNRMLVYKGKPLRTKDRGVVWDKGVIATVDESLEPQYEVKSYKINDLGLAIYEDSKMGFFLFDVATKNKSGMSMSKRLSRSVYITKNGDLYFRPRTEEMGGQKSLADLAFLKKNDTIQNSFAMEYYSDDKLANHEYVYFADSFDYPKEYLPGTFISFGFNNKRWIVGTANNIYGERHAVLLVPNKLNENNDSTIGEDEILEEVANDSHNLPSDSEMLQRIFVKYGNNSEGLTTLHCAIKRGDDAAVKLLLKYGADINSTDGGLTAVKRAVIENQLVIAKIFLENGTIVKTGCGWSLIHYAAKCGNADMIRLIHCYGGDYNHILPESNNVTPLHIASQYGNFDAIKALIKLGADINIQSTNQNTQWYLGTPLDYAAWHLKYSDNPTNLELIKFLIENGAHRKYTNYNNNCQSNGPITVYVPCPVIHGYLQSVGR